MRYQRNSVVWAVLASVLGCGAAWSQPQNPAPVQQQAGPDLKHADFLRQFARTNRFRFGAPASIKVLAGGDVLFLRSEGPESPRQDLWLLSAENGVERRLLAAEQLLGGKEETLTAEELARRERMRMSARGIGAFGVSPDGTMLLVPLGENLFLVDMESARAGTPRVSGLSTGGAVIDPRFSPDGKRISFCRDGSLWVLDAREGAAPVRISPEGGGDVSYGEAEFVAQEEMGRMHGSWWSPDSSRMIYQRTDNGPLETFTIADPSDPAKPPQSWKYPRAGKSNAEVTLWLSPPIGGGETTPTEVRWDRAAYPYVANVTWPKKGEATVLVQNRTQTEQRLLAIDTSTGATRDLLVEQDKAWINIADGLPLWSEDGERFLWLTEQGGTDGWELQVRSAAGAKLSAYTVPQHHIVKVIGAVGGKAGEPWRAVVAASPADDSARVAVFAIALEDGAVGVMAEGQGVCDAVLASDGGAWVIQKSQADGVQVHELRKRSALAEGRYVANIRGVAQEPPFIPNVEFVRISVGDRVLAAKVVRPRDFDSSKKYPVLNFAYAGPGYTQVNANARQYLLNQWYADQGFIVVSLDNRGTPRRGRAWERIIKGDFISAALEDQSEGMIALCARFPEMDRDRMGVYGWSFGGYFAAMGAIRRPDVYKAAVAGAPVADWLDYDTHYTERFMGLPDANPDGYARSNVLTGCENLRVPLLLIHGTADDNVYIVHSLKLADALFRAGREFEFLPLPGQTHMVTRPDLVESMHRRIASFFLRNLGTPR